MADPVVTILAVTVDDDPSVLLASGGNFGADILLTTDDEIAVGPTSAVTFATGIKYNETMTQPWQFRLGPGEKIYGICDTGANAAVQVLVTNRNVPG